MQGVRRARATGTGVILRAGVSYDLKVVRRLDHEAARWGIGYVPIGEVDCVLTVFAAITGVVALRYSGRGL